MKKKLFLSSHVFLSVFYNIFIKFEFRVFDLHKLLQFVRTNFLFSITAPKRTTCKQLPTVTHAHKQIGRALLECQSVILVFPTRTPQNMQTRELHVNGRMKRKLEAEECSCLFLLPPPRLSLSFIAHPVVIAWF